MSQHYPPKEKSRPRDLTRVVFSKISSLLVGTKKLTHSTNFVWPGLVFGTLEVKCNRSPTYTSMVKKIEALKQTSFNHGDTQIQGMAVLRLGTNRVN